MSPSEHTVLFYNDQAELIRELAGYVDDALDQNANAVIVATRDHRVALQTALGPQRAQAAVRQNRLVMLDAEQTLALFMRDGRPDPAQFEHTVGGLLKHYAPDIGKLRVYGEMVALLWDQGHTEGALELEELWGHLLARTAVRLLCAYPLQDTLAQRPDGLVQIADRHSNVHLGGQLSTARSRSPLLAR